MNEIRWWNRLAARLHKTVVGLLAPLAAPVWRAEKCKTHKETGLTKGEGQYFSDPLSCPLENCELVGRERWFCIQGQCHALRTHTVA